MNILLVEPDYRSKFPPLDLMRLSSDHRELSALRKLAIKAGGGSVVSAIPAKAVGHGNNGAVLARPVRDCPAMVLRRLRRPDPAPNLALLERGTWCALGCPDRCESLGR